MDIIWDPQVIQHINESDMRLYLEFSSTACVPGGGCDVEQALQVLYHCNGDIKVAMEKLLKDQQVGPSSWTEDEIHLFYKLLPVHNKKFHKISQELPGKSVKDCVRFYYLSKKPKNRSPQTMALIARSSSLSPTNSPPSSSSTATPLITSTPVIASNITPNITPNITTTTLDSGREQFPCRVCGRVFEKIKSRSAHMKRHKNGRWSLPNQFPCRPEQRNPE